jgi:hypothetical protein
MDMTSDLELHLALQHGHQLVRGVPEVLPALAGRVGPQVAGEATPRPASGELLSVRFSHPESSPGHLICRYRQRGNAGRVGRSTRRSDLDDVAAARKIVFLENKVEYKNPKLVQVVRCYLGGTSESLAVSSLRPQIRKAVQHSRPTPSSPYSQGEIAYDRPSTFSTGPRRKATSSGKATK